MPECVGIGPYRAGASRHLLILIRRLSSSAVKKRVISSDTPVARVCHSGRCEPALRVSRLCNLFFLLPFLVFSLSFFEMAGDKE